MKRLARTAVWLVVAGLGLSHARADEIGIRFTDSDPLFTTPTCNIPLAVTQFKERIAKAAPGVNSDGHFPWPDMFGYWLDTSRDLVIGIEYTEPTNAPYGAITVRFYSLCNGLSIAKGTRLLKAADLTTGEMKVTMFMGKAFPDRLEVVLTPNALKRPDGVEVKVLNASTMNQDCPVLDQFKVRRL